MSGVKHRYSEKDIENSYRELGLSEGDVAYVLSAMWQMAGFEGGDINISRAHFDAIYNIIGSDGTVVVTTTTMNLCNTEIPFDLHNTPSFNCGDFSEYVRRLPGAQRSLHPFGSYSAVGQHAHYICENASRHMYGPESPEARLIELGAKQVNIGLPPNINTTVHHIEHLMCVPYRYTKEFIHPIVNDSTIQNEPFYLYVRRLDVDVERNHCQRLFERIGDGLPISKSRLGRGKLYSYSLKNYTDLAYAIFADDIYIWCESPPSKRPYCF